MALPSRDNLLELFRLVVEQSPDAIIFADKDGMVRIWNHTAADLFGYPSEEAIGQSLDLIIPEHLRHAHWLGYDRALASGHTRHGRLCREDPGHPPERAQTVRQRCFCGRPGPAGPGDRCHGNGPGVDPGRHRLATGSTFL